MTRIEASSFLNTLKTSELEDFGERPELDLTRYKLYHACLPRASVEALNALGKKVTSEEEENLVLVRSRITPIDDLYNDQNRRDAEIDLIFTQKLCQLFGCQAQRATFSTAEQIEKVVLEGNRVIAHFY